MLNYLKADLYRIKSKKSLYYFLAFCSIAFIGLNLIVKMNDYTYTNYRIFSEVLLSFTMMIIGGYIFVTVYNDDIKSKSILGAIGNGYSRTQLIVLKFISYLIVTTFFVILVALHVFIIPRILGLSMTFEEMQPIAWLVFGFWFRILVFGILASAFVFTFLNNNVSLTMFIVFANGMLSGILTLILSIGFITDTFGDLSPYLLGNALNSFLAVLSTGTGDLLAPALTIIAYIAVATAAAITLFRRKELAF